MNYEKFLETKEIKIKPSGLKVKLDEIHEQLFDFQKDIVKWALRKGKSAIFAGTGLGKTLMQLEWARFVGAELKTSYYNVACKNLEKAILERSQADIFDILEEETYVK